MSCRRAQTRPAARLTIAGAAALGVGACLLASACQADLSPPGDPGVCYQYVVLKNGKSRFNVLETHVPNLETCAAALEAMRVKFLSLGGDRLTVTGAYQSNFIFVEPEGIFTSQTLNGASYLALVRTGDGRLAQPGAVRR